MWCWVNVITSVQEFERARDGMVVLLNNVWHIAVIDFGFVSSRILKLKFSRVKVYVVVVVYSFTKGEVLEKP